MWYSLLLGGFAHCNGNAIHEISAKENSISHQNKIENIVENPSVTNNEKELDKVEVIINYDTIVIRKSNKCLIDSKCSRKW